MSIISTAVRLIRNQDFNQTISYFKTEERRAKYCIPFSVNIILGEYGGFASIKPLKHKNNKHTLKSKSIVMSRNIWISPDVNVEAFSWITVLIVPCSAAYTCSRLLRHTGGGASYYCQIAKIRQCTLTVVLLCSFVNHVLLLQKSKQTSFHTLFSAPIFTHRIREWRNVGSAFRSRNKSNKIKKIIKNLSPLKYMRAQEVPWLDSSCQEMASRQWNVCLVFFCYCFALKLLFFY